MSEPKEPVTAFQKAVLGATLTVVLAHLNQNPVLEPVMEQVRAVPHFAANTVISPEHGIEKNWEQAKSDEFCDRKPSYCPGPSTGTPG